MDVPVSLGFTILQEAKLRMLEFYYDCIDKYLSRDKFEYMEMDTDSAYLAISGETLGECVKPEMRVEFYQNYGNWFPKPFCSAHANDFVEWKLHSSEPWKGGECCMAVLKHDTRTPGLFKEEFIGDGMVALNSKTYFCWSEENDQSKYSSKGLSKRTNKLTRQHFLDVLRTGNSKQGVNKGFLRKDNTTFTYDQIKTGLTYFYAKRRVMDDGVSTTNITC